jgi:hypothetical protein
MVFPRAIADKDVRPSDLETSNLILFGTKETNSLIAKFSEQLPMQLDASVTGHGLVYIFPVGERYVLVNSGLPWWSVAEPAAGTDSGTAGPPRRRGFRPLSGPPGLLMDFEDYILFKGSAENAVAAGRFDSNWRVPESDAEKLKSTGAVTIVTATPKSPN